ncbi:MAG TPA: isoprenylcysteine carboxylmethyltransferase family protein [Nitrospirae bacterium]|nr:isoprenylcysteine carboxylmethyltransferase family protein [Nitrospirota bacterium]
MGVFLRSWAAGTIHKNRELADHGPYAITRHPLYIGSFLMFTGFATIIGDDENIWFVLIIFFLFYFPAIRREEQNLHQKFKGEWSDYIERTSIFFPKKIPVNILSTWSLKRWLNNREYRAFAVSLIALTILELIHEFQVL